MSNLLFTKYKAQYMHISKCGCEVELRLLTWIYYMSKNYSLAKILKLWIRRR